MMSDKTLQDLKVDAHIAVLHTKVDALIEKQKELTQRVRANEKVVAAIGLLGSIALAFIGAGYFAAPVDAFEIERQQAIPGSLPDSAASAQQLINKFKEWEREEKRTDPDFDINNALAEYFNNGGMTPPSRKSCYNFRVTEINRVLDGDTIDVTIDLGFDLFKKERVRVAGVDTPEKRTRNLEEKELGIDATNWLKKKLEDTIAGDGDELTVRTELVGGTGKYGRLLGWLYINEDTVSLNEQMITEGYAHAYDGGTKDMNLEALREIRRSFGTLNEG